jgi:hypothetical protein
MGIVPVFWQLTSNCHNLGFLFAKKGDEAREIMLLWLSLAAIWAYLWPMTLAHFAKREKRHAQ